MEAKLFEEPFPFTAEWYETREHAPHLEQPAHMGRLHKTAELVNFAVDNYNAQSVVDLGCGDGGLLSLLEGKVKAWGYDLMQANVEAAKHRMVVVSFGDFINEPIEWGDLTVITECLEHLEDPHSVVKLIASHSRLIVASSPVSETAEWHDPVHAWAWDAEGYGNLIKSAGFEVIAHEIVDGTFQCILGLQR